MIEIRACGRQRLLPRLVAAVLACAKEPSSIYPGFGRIGIVVHGTIDPLHCRRSLGLRVTLKETLTENEAGLHELRMLVGQTLQPLDERLEHLQGLFRLSLTQQPPG